MKIALPNKFNLSRRAARPDTDLGYRPKSDMYTYM